MSNVWFVTGAGRGLGLAIAREALATGKRVVAAGRSPAKIVLALGRPHDNLSIVPLDVSVSNQAGTAVQAALQRFGRIDVLVNNAGYGQFGFFEDNSEEEVERQFRVNLFGTMHVTRAVLPVMRRQRAGHIFNVSSIGGLRGGAGFSLYAASKFAMAGWSESLAGELAPLGIHVTCVEPGYFRTDFLDASTVRYAASSVPEYAEKAEEMRTFFDGRSRQQQGDPAKLAQALLRLADEVEPPVHFLVGTDAVAVLEARIERDREQLARWRDLSASTDF